MGQQVLVLSLLLLCINCGLTQYATSVPSNQTIRGTKTSLSGVHNMPNNSLPDYTLNETRTEMATGTLDGLKNISVPHIDLAAAKENVSDTQNGLENSSNIFIMVSENRSINILDKKMNRNSSGIETQYINSTMSNTTSSILSAHDIVHEDVSQLPLTTHMVNTLNNTRKENSRIDMAYVEPIITTTIKDTSQTSLLNDTNTSFRNTADENLDVPLYPTITNNTEFGNETKQTLDSVNVSVSSDTQHSTNNTNINSTSNNNITLPEIKWRPGMKQPQTISDLIRVAGADIRFITNHFGGNFSVNDNGTHALNEYVPKPLTAETKATGNVQDVKTETGDTKLIKINHETSPTQNDALIDINEAQIPQLSNIKVSKAIVVSSRQNVEEDNTMDSNTFNTQNLEIDSIPSEIMQTDDGFLAPKTSNNIFPDVIVRNSENVESSRLDFVPNLDSRTTNVHYVPDLTFAGLNGQNGVRSAPGGGGGLINAARQSETQSRQLISFGNDPEYVIGTSSSVQIPQSIAQNHLSNRELSHRRNNRINNNVVFRGGNTDFAERSMDSGMNRATPIRSVSTDEMRPMFSDTTRFGTSLDTAARSENVRNDTPRRLNIPGGGIQGNQDRVRRLSMFDSSNGFTPRRRGNFRSPDNGILFQNAATGGSLDNNIQETSRNMVIPSVAFSNSISSEERQNTGTMSRDNSPVEFRRRQTFDGSLVGTPRQSMMTRNSDVVRGFIRPQQLDERLIPRTESFARPFPRAVFRDAVGRPRLPRAEVMPTSTGFRGVGPPMFPVDPRFFGAPIRSPGILPGAVFMPTDMFSPFPPRAPFPFL